MSLEQRYRRVLRLLPRYYRDAWEEDMVATFLDSWLTGDPEEDDAILELCKPTVEEVASVVALAGRLYVGGAGAPRRYLAWGQAVRNVVLVVLLVHVIRAIAGFVFIAWLHHKLGWLPAPPEPNATSVIASRPAAAVPSTVPPPHAVTVTSDGIWPAVWYTVGYAWIVVYLTLIFGYYRTARAIAMLAIVPDFVYLMAQRFIDHQSSHVGPWAFWVLLDLVPVLALAAFHRDAPPVARRLWLLAMPVSFLLLGMPLLAVQISGHGSSLPDWPGMCCILVALGCLVHAPRARSGRVTGTGVWSLTMILLAGLAAVQRIASLADYVNDPHMARLGVAELFVMLVAAAFVVEDGVRAQASATSTSTSPRTSS